MEGEYGAPLQETELGQIEESLGSIMDLLPDKNRQIILEENFFEIKEGGFYTRSINNRDCVFVCYENGIAKCSIEKAYFENQTGFRKPISCHLFPIRISQFGGDVLRYERIGVCDPAIEKGKADNITVLEFCKDALIRKYGDELYTKLKEETGK
ncbi:MAG: DUF3109 family protein [Ignavibacteriaceae bacterium]